MSFEELQHALSDRSVGLSFTWAEQLLNAVRRGDETKLLDELELAQYLEPDEIADLFGFPRGILQPHVSPLDVVFAMRTLIHLNKVHSRVTPRMTPSWDQICAMFSVNSTHDGTVVRSIRGGYLVSLADKVSAFLPIADSIELTSGGRFRVTELDPEKRLITVEFE